MASTLCFLVYCERVHVACSTVDDTWRQFLYLQELSMELTEAKKRCQELSERVAEKTDEVSGLCSVCFTLPCTACTHVHIMYHSGTYVHM